VISPAPETQYRNLSRPRGSSTAAALRSVVLLATIALLATTRAGAQQLHPFYGITGGATVGDLRGGSVNTDSRWGGTVGITAGVRSWSYMVTQLEASWVQKGGGDVRLDYIEVPLLFGTVVQNPGGRAARLYTGIGVAFPIGCSAGSAANLACDVDRKTEFAWPFGLQLGQWVSEGRFVAIDVRYSLGLTDAFKSLFPNNRSWQFRLMIGRQS